MDFRITVLDVAPPKATFLLEKLKKAPVIQTYISSNTTMLKSTVPENVKKVEPVVAKASVIPPVVPSVARSEAVQPPSIEPSNWLPLVVIALD